MVRLLSRSDVVDLLTMQDALQYVEDAYKYLMLDQVKLPQRIVISDPAPGSTLVMPALIGGEMNALATKIVSIYKNNPVNYNKPTTLAKILLQDINTGEVIGIMDGGLITAIRTGAATGVSVKFLARKDSKTMGIYGAGVQARKQVHGVYCALNGNLEKCKVWDVVDQQAEQFKLDLEKELGVDIEIVSDNDEILNNTDIIVAATTSTTPLFDGNKLTDGVHISSIGAHNPMARELDSNTINRASLVVADYKPACLAEAGDFIIPRDEGLFDVDKLISIGDIILSLEEGRTSDDQITVFKSVGLAVQDVAVAKAVYDKAIEQNIGQEIDF
jgi:ornithine cyclodeaminase/alanine dehydrogenase-like protein (mu-crystallin family)